MKSITNQDNIIKYRELLGVKMRLDKFFTMFLDQYGSEMDAESTDTPIWKLYRAKLKEYDAVSKDIKALEYWINKQKIVLDDQD